MVYVQVPDALSYEHNETRFECDQHEKMNWSLLDNYVVSMGQTDMIFK